MWILPSTLKESFLTAQEQGDLNADFNELASQCKQSLFWKSKPLLWEIWLRKWKQVYWLRPLFGQILKRSMHDLFVTKYTESLGDIRASHSAMPESEKVLTMSDTFGRIYLNRLKSLDRSGFILKMSQGTLAWDMKKYGEAYQVLVTELRKESLLRRKSERHTEGSDSLFSELWKTPVSSDGEGGVLEIREGTNAKYKLRDQAPHWRTPIATGFSGNSSEGFSQTIMEQVKQWPAPQTRDNKSPDLPESGNYQRKKEKGWTIDLNSAVIPWSTPMVAVSNIYPEKTLKPRNSDSFATQADNWTTPSSRECPSSPGMTAEREDGRTRNDQLPRQVYSLLDKEPINTNGKNPARLNPAWSIQLMGTTLQKTFTALLVIRWWSKSQN